MAEASAHAGAIDSRAADRAVTAGRSRLRICLAASGGGHIRQLIDLEPAWGLHEAFFVSEDTALSRSIAAQHKSFFVPHFAIGQAKLGSPLRMVWAGISNFFQSAGIMVRQRPDILITTGAGSVFFTLLWARLLGARVVAIETLARFDRPSLFARLAFFLADRRVVQSPALARYFPDAAIFDPVRLLDGPRPAKQSLLLVTVGTTLPFDRLVGMVAELEARGLVSERILIQTGIGGASPTGIDTVETLPFERMDALLREADIVVCHGGTGSLITALRQGCRVIATPRRFELGEHYDNHQAEITGAFAARGLISVANSVEELADELALARRRPPVMATTEPAALVDYLKDLFSSWPPRRQAAP